MVEVSAKLHKREPDDTDGDQHVRLRFTVTELIEWNPSVNADVEWVLDSGEDVFVAIRIGDSMGIIEPIQGLVAGVGLNLKEAWSRRSGPSRTVENRCRSSNSPTIQDEPGQGGW